MFKRLRRKHKLDAIDPTHLDMLDGQVSEEQLSSIVAEFDKRSQGVSPDKLWAILEEVVELFVPNKLLAKLVFMMLKAALAKRNMGLSSATLKEITDTSDE